MAVIFDIQRSSVHDGPGIRTTVFFKGCPLNCVWCHNPESKRRSPQLAFFKEKCVLCGKCALICENHILQEGEHYVDFDKCTACGKCTQACLAQALRVYGYEASAKEIMATVRKDKAYYDASGGGLTVSGGEPLMQFEECLELLKLAKSEGIHTCVETCGFIQREKLLEAAEWTDIFLFDCKQKDSKLHAELTGADNNLISENFEVLYASGADIILRCPVIPGKNDTEEHLEFIANARKKYPALRGVEILPYHDLGKGKAEAIGVDYALTASTLSSAEKDTLKKKLSLLGADTDTLKSF